MLEYKGYIVKPHKTYPTSFIVVTEGKGGKVPNCLAGMFTSTGFAFKEIDQYLGSKIIKETKNAKEGGKTGS